MTQQRFLAALRTRWLWLLLGVVIGAAAGVALSSSVPRTYTSHTQLFVAADGATSVADAFQGSQLAQAKVASYEQLVGGEELAGRVIDRLGLDMTPGQLLGHVSVGVPNATSLLDVTVTDDSPQRAQQIAATLGDEFTAMVDRLESPLQDGTPPIQIIRTEDASLPIAPDQPQPVRNGVLGALAGLLVAGALVFVRSRLDDSIRSVDDLAAAADAPVLGVIQLDGQGRDSGGAVLAGSTVDAESYRELRNNLNLLHADEPARTILMSSALPGEGRTTVVVNLAGALTVSGKRVAVVDADLRRRTIAPALGLADAPGVTDVVSGRVPLAEALQATGDGQLTVLSAGTPTEDPDEVLTSQGMAALLASLRADHDFVLIDAPPLLPVADAGDIVSQADGVVLLVRHGRTTAGQVRACRAMLDRLGAVTLGSALTFAPVAVRTKSGRRRTGRAWRSRRAPAGPGITPSTEREDGALLERH